MKTVTTIDLGRKKVASVVTDLVHDNFHITVDNGDGTQFGFSIDAGEAAGAVIRHSGFERIWLCTVKSAEDLKEIVERRHADVLVSSEEITLHLHVRTMFWTYCHFIIRVRVGGKMTLVKVDTAYERGNQVTSDDHYEVMAERAKVVREIIRLMDKESSDK